MNILCTFAPHVTRKDGQLTLAVSFGSFPYLFVHWTKFLNHGLAVFCLSNELIHFKSFNDIKNQTTQKIIVVMLYSLKLLMFRSLDICLLIRFDLWSDAGGKFNDYNHEIFVMWWKCILFCASEIVCFETLLPTPNLLLAYVCSLI